MIEGTEGGGAVAADVADVAVDEEDDEEVDEGYDVEDGGTGKYCSRRISRSPITMSNVRICIKKKKSEDWICISRRRRVTRNSVKRTFSRSVSVREDSALSPETDDGVEDG